MHWLSVWVPSKQTDNKLRSNAVQGQNFAIPTRDDVKHVMVTDVSPPLAPPGFNVEVVVRRVDSGWKIYCQSTLKSGGRGGGSS